jgi:hypothetical protein
MPRPAISFIPPRRGRDARARGRARHPRYARDRDARGLVVVVTVAMMAADSNTPRAHSDRSSYQ